MGQQVVTMAFRLAVIWIYRHDTQRRWQMLLHLHARSGLYRRCIHRQMSFSNHVSVLTSLLQKALA